MPSNRALGSDRISCRLSRLPGLLSLAVVLPGLALSAGAQQRVAYAGALDLPQEPAPQQTVSQQAVAQQGAAIPQGFGSVEGAVTDIDGDFVAGTRVVLSVPHGTATREAVTDDQGRFSFSSVPSGDFSLSITAPGFAAQLIPGSLAAAEQKELAPIVLAVAASVGVDVVISQHDLAEEEIKIEEKQRIAGFIPNFFVTYDWKAAPLTSRQKWELAWHTTYDPAGFLLNAAFAGVEQANNSFSGYGSGPASYGKRLGANVADYTVGTIVGGYLLPVAFHQDPRYFYMGKERGSITHRTLYALSSAVICRGDNGRWQPNYSSILGDLAAGAVSNIYYPASDRNGAALTFENGLLGTVSDAVDNVIQEFLLRRITPHTKPPNP
ncbi:carboxypeptidase-like regulatory domain-containing protein [Granulicella tundricola]|nr:carboxypeptidase-like regulatory domain-containing protein [Granulicella tundricola]